MMKYVFILLMWISPLFSFGQASAWWYNQAAGSLVYGGDTVLISSETYDIEEQASQSGAYEINSSDLEINSEANTSAADSQTVVLQFLSVAIPDGVTNLVIDSAFVDFTVDTQTGTAGAEVEIWAEDSSSPLDLSVIAAAPVDSAYYFTDMWAGLKVNQPTTATVFWDNIDVTSVTVGDYYTTPDIKSIIQELADRGDWSSGSRITLVFQPLVGYQIGEAEFESYTVAPARLRIYYHYTS